MSYYDGHEIVKTYVRTHKNLSLNDFLVDNKDKVASLSSKIAAENSKDLADVWRKRINQEVKGSNRSTKLLTLPKVVNNDWQLVFDLATSYKQAENQLEINALRVMNSASARISNNLVTMFESDSTKRKFDRTEEISNSFLSNIVMQFAHDKFNGKDNAQIPSQYMVLLEERAKVSLKFRLFLYAINQLNKFPLTDEDTHTVKLCLSRIVNLLNQEYINIYKKILGESVTNEITSTAKEHMPLNNYLDNPTRCLLEKMKELSTTHDMLLMLNKEKTSYLSKRDSQAYQVIVILEYLLNSFNIWKKNDASSPSELTSFRRFVPILEHCLADTDILVKDGENKSLCSAKHMQWNEELFHRKTADFSSYTFGKKIDFILKDGHDNELNTSEFKKKNVSKSVIISQQTKNLRDNAAIMIESKKFTKNNAITVNGIDYIGDTGYLYKIVNYQDVIVALPVSKLNTPCNLATLKHFGDTLNSLYYLKSKLIELSNDVTMGKAKESLNYDLVDVFDTVDDEEDDTENEETNVFYGPKPKKSKPNDQTDESAVEED